ncbi:MAG: hypothetical protein ACSLE1_06065 [Sphingobium sp.]
MSADLLSNPLQIGSMALANRGRDGADDAHVHARWPAREDVSAYLRAPRRLREA